MKVGSYDPEDIEGDVGYFYKIVYKLEKSFQDVPETYRLAASVRLYYLITFNYFNIVLVICNYVI